MIIKNKTKKGMASLYAVIFATLLFGIISVGFTRLIISESSRTINDDLSQSAYDAALAGVEDAKSAILSGSTSSWSECNGVMGAFGEVAIGSTNDIEQAYTCVTVSTDLKSYNTTLNDDNRMRIIPVPDGSGVSVAKISWYSKQNSGDRHTQTLKFMQEVGGGFQPKGDFIPPVTVVTLVPRSGDKVASLALRPANSSSNSSNVSASDVNTAYKIDSPNSPIDISCKIQDDYACNVSITLSGSNFNDLGYIAIDMPYGESEVDYKVELYNSTAVSEANLISFKDIQMRIDSTGRANDLFRRVEAYVDFTDQSYPFPEYAVYTNGSSSDDDNLGGIQKNFWVTYNNWGEGKKDSGETYNN